eukprot:6032575-Alexandrium_andersonii.AAC.2
MAHGLWPRHGRLARGASAPVPLAQQHFARILAAPAPKHSTSSMDRVNCVTKCDYGPASQRVN